MSTLPSGAYPTRDAYCILSESVRIVVTGIGQLLIELLYRASLSSIPFLTVYGCFVEAMLDTERVSCITERFESGVDRAHQVMSVL